MAAAGLLRHHLRRHLHSSRLNHYFHSRRSPPLPFRSFSSTGSEEDGSFPGEDLTLPEVPTSGFDSPVGGEGLWDGPVRALTLVLDVYHDVSSLPWWLISFEKLDAAKLPGLIGLFAKYYKIYLNLLSLPLFFIGFYIPQGSLVYWCTNSSLTLVQQLCLRNAKIREKLGLPDTSDNKMAKSTSAKLPGKEILPLEAQFSRESLLHEGDGLVEHQQSSQTEELSPEELLELGLQNMAANNHDKALSLLRLATEKDPGLVRGLIAIGQILYSKKSQAEAIEYFERAISKVGEEEASMLILASFGAGLSQISQGNDPEAIEHLRRISRLKEPEAPMDKACYYEGLVILASKLFQGDGKAEAAEYLRRAADYDPKFQAFCKECEQWLEEHKEENR